jgi:hypothetical protein
MSGDDKIIGNDEIQKLIALEKKVKRGPWKSYIEGREEMSGSSFIMTEEDDIYLLGANQDDQDFIVELRNIMPKIIDEIKRIRNC